MIQKEMLGFVVPGTNEDRRKPPQPKKENVPVWQMTQSEVAYGAFTMRRKGRFNSWLTNVSRELESESRTIADLLPQNYYQAVMLYLFPQEGRWLTQREVSLQLGTDPGDAPSLESFIHRALRRIWRFINAPSEVRFDRLELLRLGTMEYETLVDLGIDRISELKGRPAEFFTWFCGARPQYNDLIDHLHVVDPNWKPPEVMFRQELPPQIAFHW